MHMEYNRWAKMSAAEQQKYLAEKQWDVAGYMLVGTNSTPQSVEFCKRTEMSVELADGLDPAYTWVSTDNGSPNDTFLRLATKPHGEASPVWAYVTAKYDRSTYRWLNEAGKEIARHPITHYALLDAPITKETDG